MKCAKLKLSKLGNHFGCDIEFDEFEDDRGDSDLLKLCRLQAKTSNNKPYIFIFDRDNLDKIKEAVDESTGYKKWNNNVYSLAIPIPTHRRYTPNISIEFYYKDEELKRQDKYGRRLFLSNEFLPTGQHKEINAFCHELNKIKNSNISIICSKVHSFADSKGNNDNGDANGSSIALLKDDFAEHVLKGDEGFHDFDFMEFKNLFDVISKIAKQAKL
jgi:RNA-directed DNA polymerase